MFYLCLMVTLYYDDVKHRYLIIGDLEQVNLMESAYGSYRSMLDAYLLSIDIVVC